MPSQVFSIHPQNHRCFLFRGQPFKVLTSAEHYGAAMTADFDYDVYLQELRRTDGNMVRVFAFFRALHPSACTGVADTLGPHPEAVVSPWLRVPGHGLAADGLDRFDLDRWDPAYFARLLANEPHELSPVEALPMRHYLWRDMVPNTNTIGFGGDYAIVEKVYGRLKLARLNIARVLAEKVAEGACTRAEASTFVRRLMLEDPLQLYDRLPQAAGNAAG